MKKEPKTKKQQMKIKHKDIAEYFATKYYILLSQSDAKKHNTTMIIIVLLFVILFLSIKIFNN